ncbi:hypothetical protein [Aliiroseovarius subalbicans]|uniref:hypothetical protein n=1 Tax=Aliiroseovarius subalbicans TaxID=2925840 RepID=UPI001F5AD2FE|nr:hypothetical protein [Aliiroseovarius subalbicans]MCI2401167.1 hypothetical protein [Aliiroseovarius subalbicans]
MKQETLNQREKAEIAEKRQCLFTLLQEEVHALDHVDHVDHVDPLEPTEPTPRMQATAKNQGNLPEEVLAMISTFAKSGDDMGQLLKLR